MQTTTIQNRLNNTIEKQDLCKRYKKKIGPANQFKKIGEFLHLSVSTVKIGSKFLQIKCDLYSCNCI